MKYGKGINLKDADMNKIVELLKEDDGIFDEELGL